MMIAKFVPVSCVQGISALKAPVWNTKYKLWIAVCATWQELVSLFWHVIDWFASLYYTL